MRMICRVQCVESVIGALLPGRPLPSHLLLPSQPLSAITAFPLSGKSQCGRIDTPRTRPASPQPAICLHLNATTAAARTRCFVEVISSLRIRACLHAHPEFPRHIYRPTHPPKCLHRGCTHQLLNGGAKLVAAQRPVAARVHLLRPHGGGGGGSVDCTATVASLITRRRKFR
jgi:hypothetical protein